MTQRSPDREVRARVWPVFAAYLAAFVSIVLLSGLAAAAVIGLYPELPPVVVLKGLAGLLAGGIASSTGLVLTLLVALRTFEPAGLRLVPGRETGPQLLVMITGILTLSQLLDSLTVIVGLGRSGSMGEIRQALAGAAGEELFAAVVVIGFVAGAAEELFFRAFMQTRLRTRWTAPYAVAVTSLCFAVMHLDWVRGVQAFALALYLGFITEVSGSALPAIACHVINNAIFTLLTALVGVMEAFWPNVVMLCACALIFAGCVVWIRRSLPSVHAGGSQSAAGRGSVSR